MTMLEPLIVVIFFPIVLIELIVHVPAMVPVSQRVSFEGTIKW